MKNVAIIVVLTVLLAVAGWWGTGYVMVRLDRSRETESAPKTTEREKAITMEDIAETEREFGRVMERLTKRQDAAFLGGGIGAAAGFLAGLVVVLRKNKGGQQTSHESVSENGQ